MTTEKTKVQGYLEDLTATHFKEWKEKRGYKSDSAALNQLMAEYFGLGTSSEVILTPKPQELRVLVTEEVNHQVNQLKEQLDKQQEVLDQLWAERRDSKFNEWLDKASWDNIRQRLDNLERVAESPIESPVESPTQKKTRADLARVFGVSVEAVRKWELSGELEQRGWVVAPDTLKSPRQYIPVSQE